MRYCHVFFNSKVRIVCWTGSVPPAIAGGCVAFTPVLNLAAHPPATAGGTDRVQQEFPTFEVKPCHVVTRYSSLRSRQIIASLEENEQRDPGSNRLFCR